MQNEPQKKVVKRVSRWFLRKTAANSPGAAAAVAIGAVAGPALLSAALGGSVMAAVVGLSSTAVLGAQAVTALAAGSALAFVPPFSSLHQKLNKWADKSSPAPVMPAQAGILSPAVILTHARIQTAPIPLSPRQRTTNSMSSLCLTRGSSSTNTAF